ncbi:MAG TPA: hypothetical protein VEK07_22720 [Polyangiaceae bacterium]|nr:hypothetical protein [Polyangiaceae bacterium]
MNRHARQMQLAEVGQSGQERIKSACVDVVLSGLAAEVAVRYLAGAGVGSLRVRDVGLARLARAIDSTIHVEVEPRLEIGEGVATSALDASQTITTLGLSDPASREVALGAHVALHALRAALRVHP